MDRCALFVDAGYLLADGAMAVHGTRRRDAVSWDYSRLLELMNTLAIEHTQLPLLRCYWYEATAEGRRSPEHDALADVPGLKLRLGRVRPGRREGVDLMAYRDITTLARGHAICDAVLVSGDEDMVHAVTDAQELGIRVTAVHVAVDGNWTISRTLRQECDDLIEVDAAQLRPYVNLLHGVDTSSPPLSNGQAHSGPIPTHLQAPAGGGHRLRHAPSAHTGPQPMPSASAAPSASATPSAPSASAAPPAAAAPPLSGQHRRYEQQSNPQPGYSRDEHGSPHASQHDTSDLGSPPQYYTTHHETEEPEDPPESRQQPPAPPTYGRSGSRQAGPHQPPETATPQQYGQQPPFPQQQPPLPPYGTPPEQGQLQPPHQPPQQGQPPHHQDQPPHQGQPPYGQPPYGQPSHQNQPPPHGQTPQYGSSPQAGQHGQQPAQQATPTLPEAVEAAHKEGCDFGDSVARDAPALWLEAVLARKPRMPSDLEARLLQGSTLPIDFLLHDEVRHALRRGFWEALENSRRG